MNDRREMHTAEKKAAKNCMQIVLAFVWTLFLFKQTNIEIKTANEIISTLFRAIRSAREIAGVLYLWHG